MHIYECDDRYTCTYMSVMIDIHAHMTPLWWLFMVLLLHCSPCVSVCVFICVSIYLSIYLFIDRSWCFRYIEDHYPSEPAFIPRPGAAEVYRAIYLSIFLSVLSFYLSICLFYLFIYLSIYLPIDRSIYVSIYLAS